jgi:hypothetical protein
LVGKLEGRIALGRPRRKKENNTDVNLEETEKKSLLVC